MTRSWVTATETPSLWVESVGVTVLTVLDVPHVQMDAGHQDTNSLGALVAQQLHHLRGDKNRCYYYVITQPYSHSVFRIRPQVQGPPSPPVASVETRKQSEE